MIWTHGGLVRDGLRLTAGGQRVSSIDVQCARLARARRAEEKDARVLVRRLDRLVQHHPGSPVATLGLGATVHHAHLR